MKESSSSKHENAKTRDMDRRLSDLGDGELTTNQGLGIHDNQNSLKAGNRGPTLLEDFILREKITHFDHERIPERVVHARGSAAHGIFKAYGNCKEITKAAFLNDSSRETPVFVRFSTVVGSRGSADTVRDVRGFSTKFYTEEGNYDLVGNNMPVFFIQDAIKFPDLVHAIKPEPHHEIPQASAAHDNFWDFISLMPESMHMIMWVLSDRALPRSYRMMDGFGVHTFRFIHEEGQPTFVKLHWRPTIGVHSLTWDECQKIAGKDPDFNRRDLWESIEKGNFPEFELCVQHFSEAQAAEWDFDILDATKIVPEEIVPLLPIGKMTLNRNPENFFAETEQVAFHPGNLVPGIDFSDDPLLQGRLFSYLDTQLTRLGGPNFHQIPINRPVCPVHNNQNDGFMRMENPRGRVNYEPNSLAGGCPMQSADAMRAFISHAQSVSGPKIRERSPSFADHYSQATLFWNSQTAIEKQHIVEAAHFELGKVETMEIRERMVEHFNRIDHELAILTARGIGVAEPARAGENHALVSPSLSIERNTRRAAETFKVAVLVADGVDGDDLAALTSAFERAGIQAMNVSKFGGKVESTTGPVTVDKMFVATASVLFDAVFVPGGSSVDVLTMQGDAIHFINETFRHGKAIGAVGEGINLIHSAQVPALNLATEHHPVAAENGVVTAIRVSDPEFAVLFISAIAQYRHWGRLGYDGVPA
jgi:catalase